MSSLKDARAAGESTGSPFEVFKGVWRELGWSNVHLLGCPEGPFRERWGEGVMRAFVGAFMSSVLSSASESPSWTGASP